MLFTMKGKGLYLNQLPYPCSGMHPDTPYMVRTSIGQLCNVDIITLLNPSGIGFMPGASCGLGMFEPVTRPQVDMLKQQLKSKRD
jgi:hypothetical protein